MTKQDIEKTIYELCCNDVNFAGVCPITEREVQLFNFIKEEHRDQKRIGGEDYINHLIRVGERSERLNKFSFAREIGWSHDLFEDQLKNIPTLDGKLQFFIDKLIEFGYILIDAEFIGFGVLALTDRYTTEKYPHLNRKERKKKEIERLSKIHKFFQSIKYCDLLDNTSSIIEHDPKFAKIYLKEKAELLTVMKKGDKNLLLLCWESIYAGLNQLDIF